MTGHMTSRRNLSDGKRIDIIKNGKCVSLISSFTRETIHWFMVGIKPEWYLYIKTSIYSMIRNRVSRHLTIRAENSTFVIRVLF